MKRLYTSTRGFNALLDTGSQGLNVRQLDNFGPTKNGPEHSENCCFLTCHGSQMRYPKRKGTDPIRDESTPWDLKLRLEMLVLVNPS